MAATIIASGVEQASHSLIKESERSLRPKEFFWDQFIKYISSAVLALTILDYTLLLFRNGGVSCFHPPDTVSLIPTTTISTSSSSNMDPTAIYEFARDQALFLNSYCVQSLPITEYFPLYILVHGLLLLVPHFIWNAVFRGDFDSFFSIIERNDRLRDTKTGEYSRENFNRVEKLDKEYGASNRIFVSYKLKLFLQLAVSLFSIVFSATLLTDFTFSFTCPRSLEEGGVVPHGWPLNVTVPCVYASLRVLRVIRIFDFILITLAAIMALYGFLWCFLRQREQLGHRKVAKFSFQSCLKPELHAFPSTFQIRGRRFLKLIQEEYDFRGLMKYILWGLSHEIHKFDIRNLFSPRIGSDLDFLLMRLFRADASHGKVFRDIQIITELNQLVSRDHQLLHLYINIQQDMAITTEPFGGVIEPRLLPEDVEEEGKEEKVRTCWSTLYCCYRRRRETRVLLEEDGTDNLGNGLQNGHLNGNARRRANRKSPGGLDQSEEVEGGGADKGEEGKRKSLFCARCVVSFCLCCFKKKRKKNIVTKIPTDNQEEANFARQYKDFQTIFAESGFKGNPEKIAYFYFKSHLGNLEYLQEDVRGMRDTIYWFIKNRTYALGNQGDISSGDGHGNRLSNDIALDISFGTIGYSLVLSRAFKKVYSVNFDPYYRGDVTIKEDEFFTNYFLYKFPDDIYSRPNNYVAQANAAILNPLLIDKKERKRVLDMIVVGPVSNESHKVSINIFLYNLANPDFRCYIRRNAILLVIRPLRIASRKMKLYKYEPSAKLFEKITEEKFLTSKEKKNFIRYVDGVRGHVVTCAGVPCVFEFEVYKFVGPISDEEESERGSEGLSRDSNNSRLMTENEYPYQGSSPLPVIYGSSVSTVIDGEIGVTDESGVSMVTDRVIEPRAEMGIGLPMEDGNPVPTPRRNFKNQRPPAGRPPDNELSMRFTEF